MKLGAEDNGSSSLRWVELVAWGDKLLAESVKGSTAPQYLGATWDLVVFLERYEPHFTTIEEKDIALTTYLGYLCYVEDKNPTIGAFVMNGFVYLYPDLRSRLPNAWRALLSWQKNHHGGEGQPEADEAIGCMIRAMQDMGHHEEADALMLAADGWLREHELFMIRAEDVTIATVNTGPNNDEDIAIRMGVSERKETTKTGKNQGVRLDWSGVKKMVKQRKYRLKPKEKLFATTAEKYRKVWRDAEKTIQGWPGCAQFKIGPPHSIRHTGPSRDAAQGYRTIWQIQRRGCWSSEKSVLRYAKTHCWTLAQSRLPDRARTLGSIIFDLRGDRPTIALE